MLSILNSWMASTTGYTQQARLRLQDGDTVEEILVRARPPAIDSRQNGIRRQGDARGDGREHDEQAAVQRQLHHLLGLDDGAEARSLRPHDRRVEGHDRHLFSNVSDAEIEINPRFFTGREANALAAHGFETRELDIEPVIAGRQAWGGVDTVARGHHHSLLIRPRLRHRDGRAGNGSPDLIVATPVISPAAVWAYAGDAPAQQTLESASPKHSRTHQ